MSALFFLHNLLYRPLSMDIMLFIYKTVSWHFSDAACSVAIHVWIWQLSLESELWSVLSINLLFFLQFLSAFSGSPHLTALRLKLPVYELNHPKITQWCHTLSIWQIDKVIILMRENVFFQTLPEGKKKKRKDNVWRECTMRTVCGKRRHSVLLVFYFIPNNLHL